MIGERASGMKREVFKKGRGLDKNVPRDQIGRGVVMDDGI